MYQQQKTRVMQKRQPSSSGIIGPEYCHPHNVDLQIVRNVMALADNFTVTNVNGKIIFNLNASLVSHRDHRLLLDAAGKPVVALCRKVMAGHDRWEAFRGESKEMKDLIFSVKRSSMFQLKTKFEVFLASNIKEESCDFKVKGSWLEQSCVVYAGESLHIVAQMHKKQSVQSGAFGKDNFGVTIHPNVDYAFVVALILILEEINQDKRRR